MRTFIQRALNKLEKLDAEAVKGLIQDLAREHENLEVVLDSMTDGVIGTDTEHRVTVWNKAADRLLGLGGSDIADKQVWVVINDSDIRDFIRSSLLSEESVWGKDFSVPGPGGQIKTLHLTITPLVQAGKVQGSITRIQDISEKLAREARLRRAESLASLTTLTAGVAHEIKNPLGSISIHIQLVQRLLKEKKKVSEAEIGPFLSVINEEIERLNRVIVDFLFAVRPMDIQPAKSCLNNLVSDLVGFFQYELADAKIKISTDLEENLPHILMDEKFMKQAIINIVKNAMNAMPDGGQLSIATFSTRDEVEITFTDTGVGMSAEVMSRIFEPYFTTREFGSGIGLTLVYKIIKEHGGEITVDSQEGKGTTFTLSFPIPAGERPLLGESNDSVSRYGYNANPADWEMSEGEAGGANEPGGTRDITGASAARVPKAADSADAARDPSAESTRTRGRQPAPGAAGFDEEKNEEV